MRRLNEPDRITERRENTEFSDCLHSLSVDVAPDIGPMTRETPLEKPNAIGELNERSLHRALLHAATYGPK